MKKLILGISLLCGMALTSNDASAQTFDVALAQYKLETGGTSYQGQEIMPEWFRHKVKYFDINGDGINDGCQEWDEFWLFGHRIWTGPVTGC